jgi:hypothetical protein
VILAGLIFYIFRTRAASYDFRAVMYSVFAINLVYTFLTLLSALTFMQYSLAYNAAELTGKQSGIPVYVYKMPEAARELALYSKAPCHAIDTFNPESRPKQKSYLVIRHDQLEQLRLGAAQYLPVANMNLVVHKTGTFNKLLQLAKGIWPLENIDIIELPAS